MHSTLLTLHTMNNIESVVSFEKVTDAMNVLKKFAITKCESLFPVITNAESIVVSYNYENRAKSKQKLITDYALQW